MSRQLLWLAFTLFIVHHQLAETKRHSRFSVKKLFEMGLKSLDRAAEDNDDNEDDGEGDYDDEYDNTSNDNTPTKSPPKKPDKPSSGVSTHESTHAAPNSHRSTVTAAKTSNTNETKHEEHKHTSKREVPKTHASVYSAKRTDNKEDAQKHLRMRDRSNLLRIKVAADRIESLLGRFDMGSSASDDESETPTTTTTQQTTTTPMSPYPGAYQGYMPVVSNNTKTPNSNSEAGNKSNRSSKSSKRSAGPRYRYHNSHRDGRWRRVPKNASHHKQYKKLQDGTNAKLSKLVNPRGVGKTKGLQMTVMKTSNCTHSSSVVTDILKTVWSLQKSVYKLGARMNKGIHKLGNQGVDNTNEERADIKTNSDRISQLQQGLSGKVDDLRYNITGLMTSQKELGKSVSGALEDMMDLLKQMVTMVTGKESTHRNRSWKIKKPSVNKPGNRTKTGTTKATPHTTKSYKVKNINKKETPHTTKSNKVIDINKKETPHTQRSYKVKDINKNANVQDATKGFPQVKSRSTNKGKTEKVIKSKSKKQINLQKGHGKSQNERKPAGKVRRRNSKSSDNTSGFHNDHSLPNKFKNNEYSDIPFHGKVVSDYGHGLDKKYMHTSHSLDRPQHRSRQEKHKHKNGHHKRSEDLHTLMRRNKGSSKPRGEHDSDIVYGIGNQARTKSKNRSHRSRSKAKDKKNIDEELERLLREELNDLPQR